MIRPSVIVPLAVGLVLAMSGQAMAGRRPAEMEGAGGAGIVAAPARPATSPMAAAAPDQRAHRALAPVAPRSSLPAGGHEVWELLVDEVGASALYAWLYTTANAALAAAEDPKMANKPDGRADTQALAPDAADPPMTRSADAPVGEAAADNGQGTQQPSVQAAQPKGLAVWSTLVPPYSDATPLPAQGKAMYYNPGIMSQVLAYRLSLGQVSPCPDCIGYVALLRRGDINRKVWIQWPGGEVDGPYLVVDVAAKQHVGLLLARDWVVDVDNKTAVRRGMNGPLSVTVLVGPAAAQ